MLDDLDHQIAVIFFHHRPFLAAKTLAEQAAAQGDMGAVVGQRGRGGVGQHHQVVDNDPRLLELADGVELAARQGAVAEPHVLLLHLPPLPARQTGVEEQFAIELVGDQLVELFLPKGRIGRHVHVAALAMEFQGKVTIGKIDEQLQQQEAAAGFAGGLATGQLPVFALTERETDDLRRGVVADQVFHQLFAGVAQAGMQGRSAGTPRTDGLG